MVRDTTNKKRKTKTVTRVLTMARLKKETLRQRILAEAVYNELWDLQQRRVEIRNELYAIEKRLHEINQQWQKG